MANFRVTVTGKLLGQLLQNVFFLAGGEGQWTHQSVKDYIVQWYVGTLRPVQQSGFTWEIVDVRNDGPGPQPVSSFTIGPLAGTGTGNGIANPMAFIIQKRTGLTGRHNRGRIYMPGPLANHTSNGVINSAGVTAFNNVLAALNANFATAASQSHLRMVLCSTVQNATPPEVTHFLLAPTMGVQRRRNVGVGD